MVTTGDAAFRLMEVVRLLLPLALILMQVTLRYSERTVEELSTRWRSGLLGSLLTVILTLTVGGSAGAFVALSSLQSVMLEIGLFMVYLAFVGLGAAGLVLIYSLQSELVPADEGVQQRISMWDTNDERREADTDENEPTDDQPERERESETTNGND